MVKFKCLIHKETGLIIKYMDWLKCVKADGRINISKLFPPPRGQEVWGYASSNVLYDDDFEIIYNSEFTELELIQLYTDNEKLRLKLKQTIDTRHNLNVKYSIHM